jgi:hypothetical protein
LRRVLAFIVLLAASGWIASGDPQTLAPSHVWGAAVDSASSQKKSAGVKNAPSGKKSKSAAKDAGASAPAPVPKDAAARAELFKKECLESRVALAKEEKPYLVLDPRSGELRLEIRALVLARYPAEAMLPGRNLDRMLHQRQPSSPITKPFEWAGFEKRATAEAVEALSVRFQPPLRIDFQTSPSDFYWMRLRRKIADSLPWGKEDGLSIMLFHDAASLAAVAPVLADSLPLVFAVSD